MAKGLEGVGQIIGHWEPQEMGISYLITILQICETELLQSFAGEIRQTYPPI